MNTTALQQIADQLIKARRMVVFTGAGMSAESGIATFRDKPDSLWAKFNTREMASPAGWREDKYRVWAWYEGRRGAVLETQPHAGHLAVAQLADTLRSVHGQAVQVDVVTQNVDNLHERIQTLLAARARGEFPGTHGLLMHDGLPTPDTQAADRKEPS